MAATVTAFRAYNRFKDRLGRGDVNLTAANFYGQLLTSASNCADLTLSTLASVTGTAAGANTPNGRALANVNWSAASAAPSEGYTFTFDAIVFTASTNTWTVKFMQVYMSGAVLGSNILVGYWQLVAADTEVTDGNTVTVTPNTNAFKLSGALT